PRAAVEDARVRRQRPVERHEERRPAGAVEDRPRVVRGGVAGERAVRVEALDLPGPLLALARPKAVDHAAAALEREPAGRAGRIRGQRHEAAGAIGAAVHPQERAILGALGVMRRFLLSVRARFQTAVELLKALW